MAELDDRVGLPHTPCLRRFKRMEEDDYIQQRVTPLNAEKLDLKVSVHACLTIKRHDVKSLLGLESSVQEIPEIVECYSVTGEKDYLLRMVVNSVVIYEALPKNTLYTYKMSRL